MASNTFRDPIDPYPDHYQFVGVGDTRIPRCTLTIDDIVRLAQAGIAMNFDQIADQIRPNPIQKERAIFDATYILQPILERWRMAAQADGGHLNRAEGLLPSIWLSATRHDEKVYVFAHAAGQEPCIIEDDATIYPSDALMAKLAMLDKLGREKSYGQFDGAQTAQQAPSNPVPGRYHTFQARKQP